MRVLTSDISPPKMHPVRREQQMQWEIILDQRETKTTRRDGGGCLIESTVLLSANERPESIDGKGIRFIRSTISMFE